MDGLTTRGAASEALRFFGLTSPWMAAALQNWGNRAIVELGPDICSTGTIEHKILNVAIPEIAQRLQGNRSRTELDDFSLRNSYLSVLIRAPKSHSSPTWCLLTHDIEQGNPLVIALDRIYPPNIESDWAAARISKALSNIGIGGMTWRPELLAGIAA